jgi:hypothetical protein
VEWSRLEDPPASGAREASVARRVACERQKAELRRERDRMLLAIGDQLGAGGLAQQLGSSEAVADAMIARARERLQDAGPDLGSRRSGNPPDPDRWAEADRLYEALGRADPTRLGPQG